MKIAFVAFVVQSSVFHFVLRSSCLRRVCELTRDWRLLWDWTPLPPWWGACFSSANSDSTPATDDVVSVRFPFPISCGVGGEVEVGLALDFNFNLNENKLWALCILYLCILRHSFSLFASVMLRDFRVYLKIQMDGHGLRVYEYVTVDALHRYHYNCSRLYRELSKIVCSLNECQMVWTMADLTVFAVGVN